jgi:hypothetical protein
MISALRALITPNNVQLSNGALKYEMPFFRTSASSRRSEQALSAVEKIVAATLSKALGFDDLRHRSISSTIAYLTLNGVLPQHSIINPLRAAIEQRFVRDRLPVRDQ